MASHCNKNFDEYDDFNWVKRKFQILQWNVGRVIFTSKYLQVAIRYRNNLLMYAAIIILPSYISISIQLIAIALVFVFFFFNKNLNTAQRLTYVQLKYKKREKTAVVVYTNFLIQIEWIGVRCVYTYTRLCSNTAQSQSILTVYRKQAEFCACYFLNTFKNSCRNNLEKYFRRIMRGALLHHCAALCGSTINKYYTTLLNTRQANQEIMFFPCLLSTRPAKVFIK